MNETLLQYIPYTDLALWDVKRLFLADIKSIYEIVPLGSVITERSEKVKLFEFPEKEFGILGVNNKVGLFDAYKEMGSKINQPYKKVENGDLAYNPYRINVGSVGLKTETKKHDYISPAYVVFTPDNKKLLPEFLYILFRTNIFNKMINDNTTGSVRQNLKYSTLASIKIPLPATDIQNKIVEEYNQKIKQGEVAKQKADEIENEIEDYLEKVLGIKIAEKIEKKKKLDFVDFVDLVEWNFDKIVGKTYLKSEKYKLETFQNLCEKITDGTHQTPTYTTRDKGIIFLSAKDVTTGKIDWSNVKYIPRSLHKKIGSRICPQKNDILLAKNGTTGVAALLDNEKDFSIYVSLALLRPNSNKVNPYFLLYYINSQNSKKQFNKNLVGVGVPNLHLSVIRNILIPLPPLSVQEEIVLNISEKKEKFRNLKTLVEGKIYGALQDFEKEIFSE